MKLLWHKPINLFWIEMSLIEYECYCRVYTDCNLITKTEPYFNKLYLTMVTFKPEPDMHSVPFGNSTSIRFQLFLDRCPSCLAATYLHYRFDYFDYRPFYDRCSNLKPSFQKNGRILDFSLSDMALEWIIRTQNQDWSVL